MSLDSTIKRLIRSQLGRFAHPQTDPKYATIFVKWEMDLPIFFGEWLKRRRKTLDLTQAELGQRAGCSVFTLRKIESGERRPSKQLAQLLARALEIPPDQVETFIKVARGDLQMGRLEPVKAVIQQNPPAPPRDNLPRSLTSFIGRTAELSALSQLLHDPSCRILTLVGPGGIGKTRLAIEFASQQLNLFPDGVYFVPLAPLSSPSFLLPAIADALGFDFQGQGEPKVQLVNYLRGKQTLLVLDNIEHLISGVDLLVELLECISGLKLLVTSRELLNLKGEWIFEIQGLPVPPLSELDRAEEFSAVALFLHCARRTSSGFKLMDEDRRWIVKICRILDGMPLGIELAAAWIRMLSCQEIYTEVENSIDFLSIPARDLPERHQSMRAVFEHSWRMLTESEQQALAKLSVFRGGFKREAADQVAGADLSVLLSLTSKSLIRRTQGDRYEMHELLRQYVTHLLKGKSDEEAVTRNCHSAYYLGWMRESEKALMSHRQREVLAEMTAEISNLRAAWEWAVNTGQVYLLEETAWPIFYLHELRSLFAAGEKIFINAIRKIQDEAGISPSSSSTAYLEAFYGYLAARQGKITEARQVLQHSLEIMAGGGDSRKYAVALLFSGIVLRYTGESQKASDHLRIAHALSQVNDQGWVHCASAVMVGVAERDLDNLDESKKWLEKGLQLSRIVGEPAILAYAISSLIQSATDLKRFEEIELLLEQGLKLSDEAGHHFTRAILLEQGARLCFASGDPIRAKEMGKESTKIYRELNDMWHLSRVLTMMGKFDVSSGNASKAEEHFIEAVEVALQDHLYPSVFEALVEMSAGLKNHDDTGLALCLIQLILQHPSATKEVKERAGQVRMEMESQFCREELEQLLSGAANQSVETVVKDLLNRVRLKREKTIRS
jgi:predicted ATPase/transcriptional regulator with XRE-family HTH domain